MHEELINAPLGETLERLHDRDVFVRVLAPPYPAAGKGRLRVVRVEEQEERIELVVTYDDYDKLPGVAAREKTDA